jgi:hypothetical protein
MPPEQAIAALTHSWRLINGIKQLVLADQAKLR